MPSNHLILCRPLLLLPSIFPSITVFSSESVPRIRWPKYWSFSFSVSPSSDYSGLISFRMDWLDLLAVQGTLKSLLQHHSSKASILRHSAFFVVQLSYPYMTTGKTTALTRWTFVGKVMFLIIAYTKFSIILKTFPYVNGLIPSHRYIVVTAILRLRTHPYSSHLFYVHTIWVGKLWPWECGGLRTTESQALAQGGFRSSERMFFLLGRPPNLSGLEDHCCSWGRILKSE